MYGFNTIIPMNNFTMSARFVDGHVSPGAA